MWILLSIIAFIVLLITVILMLPVYVIIKNNEDNELILRYKILFKTFGEHPDPDSPVLKILKRATGIGRLEKSNFESSTKAIGLPATASQSVKVVTDLLREVVTLLKYCTVNRLHIKVVCANEDAADTAINYGACCATIYPLVGFLNSVLHVRKDGQDVDISCNYLNGKDEFHFDFLISVRLYHVLAAFLRISYEETKRTHAANLQLPPDKND